MKEVSATDKKVSPLSQVIAVARTADLVMIMLDATKSITQRRLLEAELEAVGIRLNTQKPNVYFKVHNQAECGDNGLVVPMGSGLVSMNQTDDRLVLCYPCLVPLT